MRTQAEQVAWQLQCYGMTEEALREQIESGVRWYSGSKAFLATSILSDVQALIESGSAGAREAARQKLNCVKYMLSEYSQREMAEARAA